MGELTKREQQERALEVIRFAVGLGYGPQTDAEVEEKVEEILTGRRALPGNCPTPSRDFWRLKSSPVVRNE